MRDSFLVNGVAFKKTFSYAGFEQQPKKFLDPKILLLNVELELKSEKENAEIRCQYFKFVCFVFVDFGVLLKSCLVMWLPSLISCVLYRLSDPSQYQSIVDAEWNIIYDKLDKCVQSGAKVVLSRLAIGDLATQVLIIFFIYFSSLDQGLVIILESQYFV
jgi:T-complex protein 1 subunit eta